jgi:hypothetical protein
MSKYFIAASLVGFTVVEEMNYILRCKFRRLGINNIVISLLHMHDLDLLDLTEIFNKSNVHIWTKLLKLKL